MKSYTGRIPANHFKEIQKIANNLNISFTAAFQIWERKKGGSKDWQDY